MRRFVWIGVFAGALATSRPATSAQEIPLAGTSWAASGKAKLKIPGFSRGRFPASGAIGFPDAAAISVDSELDFSFTRTFDFNGTYVRRADAVNKFDVTVDAPGLEAVRSFIERDLEAFLASIQEPRNVTVAMGEHSSTGSVKARGRKLATKSRFDFTVTDADARVYPGNLKFKYGGTPAN